MAATHLKYRLVIEGGRLKSEWVPKHVIRALDGCDFLPIHADDYSLKAYVSHAATDEDEYTSLNEHGFVDYIKNARNDAVTEKILEHLKADDPYLSKVPANARKIVDASSFPNRIDVRLQADGFEARVVVLKFELKHVRSPAILCECANMDAFRTFYSEYTMSGAGPPTKRRKPNVSTKGLPEFIRYEARANRLVALYNDADGREQKLYEKVADTEPDTINAAAATLVRRRSEMLHAED